MGADTDDGPRRNLGEVVRCIRLTSFLTFQALRPERRIGSTGGYCLSQNGHFRPRGPEGYPFRQQRGVPRPRLSALAGWRGDHQHYPGQPLENGFVESFYSCFRGECLNREQFWTLTEAHVVIEDSRLDDNSARP